jgi:hypothetical protein
MRHASGPIALAVLLVLGGCGARTGLLWPKGDSSDGPRDAAQDVPRDLGDDIVIKPLCATDAGSIGANPCKRSLKVGTITVSMPTCYIDLAMKYADVGTLLYDCSPTGAASATFSTPRVFFGTYDGSKVDICTGTIFHWSDGCIWSSSQRISGDPKGKTLTFTYTEKPAKGGSCMPPCTATGPISIEP